MSANAKDTHNDCVKSKTSGEILNLGCIQDSGYETDLSNSLLETTITGSDMCVKDLPGDVEIACINNDKEIDNVLDCDSDSDSEIDREVAELLGHSLKIRNTHRSSCGKHVQIQRPCAPLPEDAMCCGGMDNRICARNNAENSGLDVVSCKMCRHARSVNVCKLCSVYYFRPINKSDATKRQDPHAEDGGADVACKHDDQPVMSRVTNADPIVRQRSEYGESSGALPDLIPNETQRSKSLPDIVALRRHHENEMGRELRRIGDEFETAFRERNARKVQTVSWSVFNCSLTLHLSGYFNTIKRVLSPEPTHSVEFR